MAYFANDELQAILFSVLILSIITYCSWKSASKRNKEYYQKGQVLKKMVPLFVLFFLILVMDLTGANGFITKSPLGSILYHLISLVGLIFLGYKLFSYLFLPQKIS